MTLLDWMYAIEATYGTLKRPPNISAPRWAGMIAWNNARFRDNDLDQAIQNEKELLGPIFRN